MSNTNQDYFNANVAAKYTKNIFNAPIHTTWISSVIAERLQLQPGHRLVDMGCGPGHESISLLENFNHKIEIIGKRIPFIYTHDVCTSLNHHVN